MSNKTDMGGPAFPVPNSANVNEQEGMTLWDYYAAAALTGIMGNSERWKQIASDYKSGKKSYDECSKANAAKAASIADAMLAERAKREGDTDD